MPHRYRDQSRRVTRDASLQGRSFEKCKKPRDGFAELLSNRARVQLTRFQVWPPQNRPPNAQPWTRKSVRAAHRHGQVVVAAAVRDREIRPAHLLSLAGFMLIRIGSWVFSA